MTPWRIALFGVVLGWGLARFETSNPTLRFFICLLSCSISLVIFSLFTKCTFGYDRRRISLPLSCDRVRSNLSLCTRSEEMIIFVRGNFCAAKSISAESSQNGSLWMMHKKAV